ncbi:hypothetical protein, partial [Pseudomonas sp. GW456-11-11-14-LB2]
KIDGYYMHELRVTNWFRPILSVQNIVLFIAGCFVVALFDLNKGELASWVQAIGSIAAIVFAAYLPIWHGQVALKRRQNSLAEIMRVISDDATESLCLLSSNFLCPERERSQMAKYEIFHRGRDWTALSEQLAQIPVSELSPNSARDLSHLKDAVSFGFFVASKIPEWIKDGGHSRPDIVRVLRAKRDLVGLIRSKLPVPHGVTSPAVTHAQLTCQVSEMRRPPLEPLVFEDAEIYRRYVWKQELFAIPDYVYVQGIYTYLEGFGPSIIENDGTWSSFLEIDEFVKAMCRKLHEEYMEAEFIRMGYL